MENPEEVLQSLDEFAKLKPKDIPRELEEYLGYVAKTGDPVYQWSLVKCLFREKLLSVITDFYESCPTIDLPPCPNVDPFNYETMKRNLLERLDSFGNAPFTVQRLCELLTTPRKEYSRVDKFMRAIEKNILVVSTREPGNARRSDVMQQDFLMNGVMDGRNIDIGEAIETVSSDGVNLMHGDDAEVNISDSENIRIDCAGAEEIDMDDHPDVDATNESVWDKEGETTSSSVEEECVKEYENNVDTELENEPKITSEADEEESKEPDSSDLDSEGFSETVENEENVHSTTRENPDSEETVSESSNVPDECDKTKSDTILDKEIPDTDSGPADSVSEVDAVCVKNDVEEEDSLKAKPPEDDVDSPDHSLTAVEESLPESSVPEVEDEASEEVQEETEKDEEPVAVVENVSVEQVSESVGHVEDLSPLESLEEVTSNISPGLESKVEVTTVESVSNVVEVAEKNETVEDVSATKTEIVTEECETSSSVVDVEPEEQMEVDDIGQIAVVVQEDEPMDQSEQLCTES